MFLHTQYNSHCSHKSGEQTNQLSTFTGIYLTFDNFSCTHVCIICMQKMSQKMDILSTPMYLCIILIAAIQVPVIAGPSHHIFFTSCVMLCIFYKKQYLVFFVHMFQQLGKNTFVLQLQSMLLPSPLSTHQLPNTSCCT